jgi:hypothetical protein
MSSMINSSGAPEACSARVIEPRAAAATPPRAAAAARAPQISGGVLIPGLKALEQRFAPAA